MRRLLRRLFATAALATLLTAAVAAPATPAHANHYPAVGSTVCHHSPVAGYRCGTVTNVNLTVYFPTGPVHGLFRYTACAYAGDAGIPVIQFGHQVGTVVAGSGWGGSCYTYAEPS